MTNNNTSLRYEYYTDWSDYAYPTKDELTTPGEIARRYTRVDLGAAGKLRSGGIPVMIDGSGAYVNAENENTVIFGETGSKKSRSVIVPLAALTAGAQESAVITDVKGELYTNPKLRGYMKSRKIQSVCLDFRTFSMDGCNILEQPFRLYREGNVDKALSECSAIVSSLSQKYDREDDPVWAESAVAYLKGLIELMFIVGMHTGQYSKVNMITLSGLANSGSLGELRELEEKYRSVLRSKMTAVGYNMLVSVLLNPAEKMVGSILGFVHGIVQPFASEPKLAEMLSRTTFRISDLYERPTFIFIIVPDETSAYDMISGLLIDRIYTSLISQYSARYMNREESPCRINFICDEFCNLNINDMKAKISASRSRNMRWFLVCQSKDQLETTYRESAGTILGNCRNTLFLKSSDNNLLNYISDLCGNTCVCESGGTEKLVTPKMLKGLRKERDYKEALFIDGSTVFFTKLPDYDSLELLRRYSNTDVEALDRDKSGICSEPVGFFSMNDIGNTLSGRYYRRSAEQDEEYIYDEYEDDEEFDEGEYIYESESTDIEQLLFFDDNDDDDDD